MKNLFKNNLILNCFDRSGSNAIVKVLEKHPQIEIMMHPFNSGSIRRKTNILFTDKVVSEEDKYFFQQLEKQNLNKDYIKSDWFYKNSSTTEFLPGKLHILKTTLNHFSTGWVMKNYPGIEIWGIWRNPYDIIASILRNDFYNQWYNGFSTEIILALKNDNDLYKKFSDLIGLLKSDAHHVAFIIAVKNYYFFREINTEKVFDYQDFKEDPNNTFKYFLSYFGLFDYKFENDTHDLNIVGQKYIAGKNHRNLIPEVDIDNINIILKPLKDLVKTRYSNSLSFDF